VYVDVNRNGQKDVGEPGIVNVRVYGPGGLYTTTDAAGLYTFHDVLEGSYEVSLDATEAFFSGPGKAYFRPVRTLLEVAVGPADSLGNDMDTEFLVNALRDDVSPNDPDRDGFVLMGNGHTIGYWKHQLTSVLKNKVHQVDANTLNSYIDFINANAVGNVFVYPSSDPNTRFQSARDTMNAKTSDSIGLLKKQLHALMFNELHGLGLGSNYHPIQALTIAAMQCVAASGETEAQSPYSREEILSYQRLADDINNMENLAV
jgi:hypothetical protein